jgi:proteic killer suppression protein
MEISFKDSKLSDLYEGKKVKDKHYRYSSELINQYIKTIRKLDSITKIEQLYQYTSLNYEKLKGNLKGYSSVRINKQYRLIFEEILSEEEPFEVKLLAIEEISNHYS